MNLPLVSWLGLMAPLLFLYPYAMVSLGKWQSNSLRFHILNFLGAALILLSLLVQWNLPVFIMEICWAAISAYGICKALRKA